MIDIGFFYLLLLLLILVLLFIIVLYSGSHFRTIAPPLMNASYGLSTTASSSITSSYSPLVLLGGDNLDNGSLMFGTSIKSLTNFEFEPLSSDRNRKISGKMLMYAESVGTSVWFNLQIKDGTDVVGEPTQFVLQPGDNYGLQTIQMVFDTKERDTPHKLQLEAKGIAPTPSFSGTSININSAYFTYI